LNNRHQVDVYDLRTGKRTRTLRHLTADGPVEGHGFRGFTADWSPDGRYLATGLLAGEVARDSPMQVWDIATGRRVRRLGKLRSWLPLSSSSDAPAAPVWSPDGRHLAGTGSGAASITGYGVRLWSAISGAPERTLLAEEPVCEMAWSPTGEYLAGHNFNDYWGDTTDHTAVIWIWDRKTGRRRARLTERRLFLSGLSWSPGGGAIASAGSDGKVRVWAIPGL
jgi:WD40 repeat protein